MKTIIPRVNRQPNRQNTFNKETGEWEMTKNLDEIARPKGINEKVKQVCIKIAQHFPELMQEDSLPKNGEIWYRKNNLEDVIIYDVCEDNVTFQEKNKNFKTILKMKKFLTEYNILKPMYEIN